MTRLVSQLYEFGPFCVDPVRRLLLRDGEPIPLTPKAFDTLLALVENNDRVLEKDELLKIVWPDAVVEERNLTVNISTLRKALGEAATEHRYIVTIPGRGYRFAAAVKEFEEGDLIVERHSRSHVVVREHEGEQSKLALPAPASRRNLTGIVVVASVLLVGATAALISVRISSNGDQAKAGSTAESIPAAARSTKSIAVLPFKTIGAGKADEYLKLGLADALITRLGKLRQITVRPTSAVQRFSSNDQDPVAVARALGVEYVLDSRVQRLRDRIRVTAQLLSAEDGATLWTEKFDERFTDIFALQDSISNQAARAMLLNLTADDKNLLTKRHTSNAQAYEDYLKGRYFWNKRTAADIDKALKYFQQATEIDPNYAQAYTGMADCNILLSEYPYSPVYPREGMPKAKAAVLKALELDDTLAEAHNSLAYILAHYDWNFQEAEREFKRSIELNPNYATARQWYAEYLNAMGRFDESRAELKRAQELDPLSLIIGAVTSLTYYCERQYDQAAEPLRKTLDLDPNFGIAHMFLAWVYERKEMYEQAAEEFLKFMSLSGASPQSVAALKRAYAERGWRGFLQGEVEHGEMRSRMTHVTPLHMVHLYASLGEKDRAFEWLEKAYQERNRFLILLKADPTYDPLRSDPRYPELLRRIGLAP